MIDRHMRDRGYPPSVREIGEAVGLTSPSTVHNHLASLQRRGLLRRDPTKPRAIEVRWDPSSDAALERRPSRSVPLIGDVAAGTDVLAQENVEELHPLPADFVGDGELFMLRVRGESMIDAGILDGDFVVARTESTAQNGDIVVAGIPGEEATVKTYRAKGAKVALVPANPRWSRSCSTPTTSPSSARSSRYFGGSDRHDARAELAAGPGGVFEELTGAGSSRIGTASQQIVQRGVGPLDRRAGYPLVLRCGRAWRRQGRSWRPGCRGRRSGPRRSSRASP